MTYLVGRAAQGAGDAVLVAGDAGVGKSRLIAELEDRAVADGALVLRGACIDLAESELSYGPVIGGLRDVARDRTGDELDALMGPARGELARLLPDVGHAPTAAPGPGAQARLFELLLGVFTRLGREQPVLLVFEDVHWADAATLDLLSFLVRNQGSWAPSLPPGCWTACSSARTYRSAGSARPAIRDILMSPHNQPQPVLLPHDEHV